MTALDDAATDLRPSIAELRRELDERTAERDEALAQAATGEILSAISRSPADIQPVFEAIVVRAATLCEAEFSAVARLDDGLLDLVAVHSLSPEETAAFYSLFPRSPERNFAMGRAFVDAQPVHFEDVLAEFDYDARTLETLQSVAKYRSFLGVPIFRDRRPIGVIGCGRREVRPFTAIQIALVKTFADQAAIAIEDVRLLGELAGREVALRASEERHGLVSEAMAEGIYEWDIERNLLWVSSRLIDIFGFHGRELGAGDWNELVHAEDFPRYRTALRDCFKGTTARLDCEYRVRHSDGQYRWIEDRGVPVRSAAGRAVRLVGAITDISDRKETDQALREALEQQTATSEVLQVINSSPGDLTPVFNAILEKAHSLCDIAQGSLELYDGEWFRAVAVRGLSDEFAEILRQGCPAADNPATQPLIEGRRFAHILDLAETDYTVTRSAAELDAARTLLCVPLRRDGALLGMIASARREVRPFSDKEIALLENFAAQAVIAMENARLINETREALEQQTATAEVLGVINSSPGDLAPVFKAILDKAHTLCGATLGSLFLFDGELFRAAAVHGYPEDLAQRLRQGVILSATTQLLDDSVRWVHNPDLTLLDHPNARAVSGRGGVRTNLMLPLRKDARLLGAISCNRQEVRPFTDKEIALLQNFAAQAVIAIENARLLTETREALEQQTATAEVLQVINSSPGDLAPVFDAMLEKATRLCEASFGILWQFDGGLVQPNALYRVPAAFAEFWQQPRRPSPESGPGRMIRGESAFALDDLMELPTYKAGDPMTRAIVEHAGARSVMIAPLRKDGAAIGAITIYRQEVRPFADNQIALLRSFADQAVIAMENARLLTETREALEQQTATAEILQVINSSPGNLQPVFAAILEKAHALGGASRGTLFLFDGEVFRAAASQGYPEGPPERMRRRITVSEDPRLAALLTGERLIHVPDLMQLEDPIARAVAERGGVRTNLLLPLRKDDALLGVLSCNRAEVRPFSEKQIALLESFAAQAVIAMDNARLLDEIRQRQAELRVTFDNMGDGVAMFDDELRLAAWNRNFQEMLDLPDALLAKRPTYADYVRALAERGEFGSGDIEAELNSRLAETDQELRLERTRPDGRIIEVRRNAVPGGGFVLIYGDITERRRAEEEIRAARDTAEHALQELKTTQTSLLHAQKMAALGQLTAGIAHEIKNPLNFVNNFAGLSVELLEELKETAAPAIAGLAEDERADVDEIVGMLTGNLEKIAEHGRRADGIVKSMLEHSRGGSGERREVDLNSLVEEALNLAYHGARAQDQSFNITLERDLDHALAPVELVPQDMTRVFLNLFGNGFYAATKRQRDGAEPNFRPALKVKTHDLGETVEIRIRDNGAGIPPEIRDKLFQPFFTTKPTGEGTGLGLSISYDIVVQQHGGTIEVDSRVGEFTEFAIRLPRSRQAATAVNSTNTRAARN